MTYTERELILLSNTDVLGYVQTQNAARNAQAKAEGWTFWTTMPEDAKFLAEYANVYELEHMYAAGTYSDIYKDHNNIRPRWDFHKLTLAELEAEITAICEAAKRESEMEEKWEKEEREHEELCAAANIREEARMLEEAARSAINEKIDMMFSTQDSLMGYYTRH